MAEAAFAVAALALVVAIAAICFGVAAGQRARRVETELSHVIDFREQLAQTMSTNRRNDDLL